MNIFRTTVFITTFFFHFFPLFSQEKSNPGISGPEQLLPDSIHHIINEKTSADSLQTTTDGGENQQDSLKIQVDSLDTKTIDGDIETTIQYSAKDSITMDVVNQIVSLYGKAQIKYGNIELTAAFIEINYLTNIITALGSEDTTGMLTEKPVFKDGPETYETDNMKYNFKTRKAIIDGVVTQQGEAYMHGTKVYKNQFDELFISKARYTTCNLAEPHFFIESKKLKVIPEEKVISGPFYIRIKDIPTPIGFLFGMFPVPRQKSSGIIVPAYGEEKRRGFFLKNGGYYFALSDYMDLQLMGEIYSKGSWGLNMATSYTKRYKYSGRLNMRYNNQKAQIEGDSTNTNDFWINWSHAPKSKGVSRFSASVSAGTSTYNQNNPTRDLQNTINQDFNSSISYSTAIRGTPFNLSVNGRLQQNVNTGIMNVMLPEMALNMNRLYPFKSMKGRNNPLKKISLSWNMSGTNRMSNTVLANPGFDVVGFDPHDQDTLKFNSDNIGALWDRAQTGVKHIIPLSTTMSLFKYIQISPSFHYQEIWYFKQMNYEWVDSENAVKIDTLDKFSRLYSYGGALSLDTRLYGVKYFKKDAKVQAIRHIFQPNAGMSFSPDFSDEKYDYYQEVQIDTLGNTRRLSRYPNAVYGTPTSGKNASAFFGITNNLELKVKSKSDTTDKATKVVIFDNLSFNSSYNFLADSFKLAPIRFSGRTRLFKNKLNLNFGATIDPYIYQLDSIYYTSGKKRVVQRRRDIFAWDTGQGLGQISQAQFSLSINLNPKARERENELADKQKELSPDEQLQMQFIRNNPELYVDFKIPWNLRLNYNFNFTKRGYEDSRITQAIQMSGNVTLTEKWSIGFQSGFDIQNQKFTTTNFNITRDLHCWQMNFSWTPFGRYESYFLTINAKSSLLQDLKINKQSSWWDN